MLRTYEIETLRVEINEIYKDLRKYHRNIFIPRKDKKCTRFIYQNYKHFYKEVNRIDSLLCSYKDMLILKEIKSRHDELKRFMEIGDEIYEKLKDNKE